MINLSHDFFRKPTQAVAKELIGTEFTCHNKTVIITETEAYVQQDDPACHAARGRTKRNEVMFGRAGLVYVYLIYGMYHCLNIVTEEEEYAAAVLIRGAIDKSNPTEKLDGPGKLCRYLNINRDHNYIDCTTSNSLYFRETRHQFPIDITPRIGITQGQDKLWRYVISKDIQNSLTKNNT